MDTPHPIDIAASIIGSQAALAVELGVSKGAVNQWKTPGRQVPADHCPVIERLTGGKVRCEDLRPDVAWDVLRAAPANAEGAPKVPAVPQEQVAAGQGA